MGNIKNFINKNKATIISVLSALLTFAISLSKIDMGTKVGVVMSILIVVIPVIISVLGGQDMEQSIKLLVNAITVIQQIVKDNKDWLDIRIPERKEYKGMCEALSNNIYKHSARPADKYDYSREANILNIIVTGSSAQSIRNYFGLNSQNELTRDSLEKDYNEKLAFLQKQNMIYLGMDMPIVERVKMLIASFDIIYPIASPILPWMSKEDMLKARTKLIDSLSI